MAWPPKPNIRCQSGSAKAHLDRSEEMLAKEAEAHEEAEAAAGHCDHVMSEGQNSRLVHRFFVFFDFESILCFIHFPYDPVGFFQRATMFDHVCATCLFSSSFPTTIEKSHD